MPWCSRPGRVPNFFGTPGADDHAFPLYSLNDAQRLRTRILSVFEAADRNPSLVERGALNFVVVGGGATGVETAGALADMIHWTMTVEYRDLAVKAARVHLVDIGHQLLGPFSERAHDYAFKVLTRKGVDLHLDTKVTEVTPQGVTLGDGSQIATRCVVWGGGIAAPGLAAAAGVPQGHGGRIEVQPDLTVEGFPRVYAIGDVANIPGPDGAAAAAARLRGAPERPVGREEPARRVRREAAAAVQVQGQGNHGDDRPRLGDRSNGSAPP